MLNKKIACLGLLVICTHLSLRADDSIGNVVSTEGSVTGVNKTGESRALTRRSPIFAGDTIKVAKGGAAQLKFTDSSMMSLAQGTDFKVDSYKHENKPSDKFSGSIEKGTMRTLTGTIAKSSDSAYKVKTPVAAMGVRGTFYACNYDNEKELARCEFFKGSGFLENAMGRLDLGADERYSYGDVAGSNSPSGYLSQSDATYDIEGIEGTTVSGAAEEATPEESFELSAFSDDEVDAFEADVDSESDMSLFENELDDSEDITDPEDTATELHEDGLDYPSSIPDL